MISAVIITYNEAHNIIDCIHSLKKITSDILVVDAESTDNTAPLAEKAGARVFTLPWSGYGNARNFGHQHALHDWIFSLDADERISDELNSEIQKLQITPNMAYQFKRINHIAKRPVSFGFMSPEWKTRLYNKKEVSWDDRKVHEQLTVSPCVRLARSRGFILHYGYADIPSVQRKMDKYARLSAEEWLRNNYKPNALISGIAPFYHFVKAYFIQLGFLQGKQGWQLANIASTYRRLKDRYYREISYK